MGTSGGRVARLNIRRGMVLVVGGMALGFAGALGATRFVADLLFKTETTDPAAFAGGGLFFVAVARLTCSIPAWRALRVDPMVAFRAD